MSASCCRSFFPFIPRTRARLEALAFPVPDACGSASRCRTSSFSASMMKARLVLTDSGGIQEETTCLGVPCLTLRENTERPVTVTQGTNRVIGTRPEAILTKCARRCCVLCSRCRCRRCGTARRPARIVDVLGQASHHRVGSSS